MLFSFIMLFSFLAFITESCYSLMLERYPESTYNKEREIDDARLLDSILIYFCVWRMSKLCTRP
ncbi:hypothetical protein CIPAW_07G121400 [Carya illinoinensis]|uniref:Uncharacterized protein n=1 Tax=Carya illinoinensis TaxID=32201 RepID=A0A8T1Q1I2_CARIL|nr:hypothetical protein CIPAW_07G121400 [Carya illinoinensis]